MTRLTANIILLTMTGVWAYLSIKEGIMVHLSDTFIYIAVLVAGGEFAAKSGAMDGLKKKFGVGGATTINIQGLDKEGKKDAEESR